MSDGRGRENDLLGVGCYLSCTVINDSCTHRQSSKLSRTKIDPYDGVCVGIIPEGVGSRAETTYYSPLSRPELSNSLLTSSPWLCCSPAPSDSPKGEQDSRKFGSPAEPKIQDSRSAIHQQQDARCLFWFPPERSNWRYSAAEFSFAAQ
jgi:hypothetical protein